VMGSLPAAESAYNTSIGLCEESSRREGGLGVTQCNDLYLLLLNRGVVRLNSGREKEAMEDLERSGELRGKPDAIVLQNRARAREINGFYGGANADYDVAIGMTSNTVAPFWLRSAMVKLQVGDTIGSMDILKRVENRFSEAPEVKAALTALLANKGDIAGATKKYLEMLPEQQKKFADREYLKGTLSWPPAMIQNLERVTDTLSRT